MGVIGSALIAPVWSVVPLPAVVSWVEWVQWTLLACVVAAGAAAVVIRQRMGVRRRAVVAEVPTAGEDPMTMGLRLFGKGRHTDAIDPLEAALSDHGDLPEVRYALGVCLLHAGRMPHAWPHLEKAIRLDPVYLQYLITRPETEAVRDQPRFEAFVRKQAKRYRDTNNQGYQ